MSEKNSNSADNGHGYIDIEDDHQGYPLNMFCIPKHYIDDLSHVMIPKGLIDDRIEKMAIDIKRDITSPLVCLCVLKGGYKFFADLVDRLKELNTIAVEPVPLKVDFIRLKSYEDDRSTEEIQVIGGDALESLTGKNVLIVEDIVGETFGQDIAFLVLCCIAFYFVPSPITSTAFNKCVYTLIVVL